MKRLLSFALVLLSATAAANTSERKWLKLPTTYSLFAHSSINGVTDFQGTVVPIVVRAFNAWTTSQCGWKISGVQFNSPSDTTAINNVDGANPVIWLGGNQWRHSADTLGLTTVTFFNTGEIFDADMEMNNNIIWSTSGAANRYDLETVLLHEMGHFIGIDHSPGSAIAVMYPSVKHGELKRTLKQPDLADLCVLYPPGTSNPTVLRKQGELCTADNQCDPSAPVCRNVVNATPNSSAICTGACGTNANCPSGYTCQQSNNGLACLVRTGVTDLCGFCTRASDCSTGNCVTDGRGHNWCTNSCVDASNCGAGYTCTNAGGAGKVCAPTATCTNQCGNDSNCPVGYRCNGGACEARGGPGDRCEINGYCQTCGVCFGSADEAYCRSCCRSEGPGQCQNCTQVACGGQQVCGNVDNSNDSICVPGSAAAGRKSCELCDASNPCAAGLTCIGNKCHTSCNPKSPGVCTSCFDAGGGVGYCACSNDVAQPGQTCGVNGAGFTACAQSSTCVEGKCRRPCITSGGCEPNEVCSSELVCMPANIEGQKCSPCDANGACTAGLTCFQNRCYEPCNPASPSCASCVEVAVGQGVCACEDQRSFVNQNCGYVPPRGVYWCPPGIRCVAGVCRAECSASSPYSCESGTSCQSYETASYCLSATSSPGVGGGGARPGPGGGGGGGATQVPDGGFTDGGCGCGASTGALAWGLLLLGMGLDGRRRR